VPVSELPQVRYTYADLEAFPEGDGKRYEIIDGELLVTPSPTVRHQAVLRELVWAVESHLREHPLGTLFFAPLDVVFADDNVVEPDLLYLSKARAERMTKMNIQGAPDLVVEVLSESTRRTDEIRKRKLFERYDVLEYWIVDPELDTVKVFRRKEARFERVDELSLESNDTLTTPLLPGFELPLARIFT
jgi:Uma2 family endonuclease